MSNITKDQAQKIIEAADEVITALAGTNEDVHPESDSMLRLWDDLNDRYAPPEVVRELARIALASLEAEPVAMRWRYLPDGIHGMGEWNYRDQGYIDTLNAYHLSRQKELLYTAPPETVSVPDLKGLDEFIFNLVSAMASEELSHNEKELFSIASKYISYARERFSSAMLQGSEPVTTGYKLPDDFDFGRFNDVTWLECIASNPQMHSPTTSTIAMVALELNKRLETGNSQVVPDGYCIMPLKLTADNGAKGALCGEFHVQYRIVCQSCVGEGCEDCNHTGGWDAEIPVSWDTIKRIHEAAVEACTLPAAPQQEVKP
ncbi:hypothetical protein [Enterobacter hormaechei]|uniref:hypothetical protein n=1 Tax=Enterobacter hormaechei TaxID=158836 RepID=UPI0035254BE9